MGSPMSRVGPFGLQPRPLARKLALPGIQRFALRRNLRPLVVEAGPLLEGSQVVAEPCTQSGLAALGRVVVSLGLGC